MQIFDFKKKQKEYYTSNKEPHYINIPNMKFLMIKGMGNPNDPNGEYQKAIGLLYAVSYAIKMSYKTTYLIPGFYEYVVPPLEGLWTFQNDKTTFDKTKKDELSWIAMIHQPDFVTEEVFQWACEQVQKKKQLDTSNIFLKDSEEGTCIQMMHQGPYDEEPVSFQKMQDKLSQDGYVPENHMGIYHHHEIYLKNNRDPDSSKWKTVLRQHIKYQGQ